VNDRSPCPFRLQKEVEMNMKKLLTTTFITVFFIIGSAFCAFASENRHSKQKKLQTIRISRKQKLPKTLKNRLPRWFPWVFLKLPVTALAEAAPQAGEETPVPVPLPAPSTPLLLTQE